MVHLGLYAPLLGKVLFQVVEAGSLFNPVLDNNARAADHLAGLALLVDLAHAGPFAQQFVVVHLDQVDAVLGTEGLNQLDVRCLVAVGGEHAEKSFTPGVGRKSQIITVHT